MSKRPITFNRPEDPSFLKKIKESIGYREGPTVDTKRQKLEDFDSDDEEYEAQRDSDRDDKPQVVVLRAGDLTEEEAEREKNRLEREEQQKPADLSQRVVFKKPTKAAKDDEKASTEAATKGSTSAGDKKQKKKSKPAKAAPKLSFDQDEEEEEF